MLTLRDAILMELFGALGNFEYFRSCKKTQWTTSGQ